MDLSKKRDNKESFFFFELSTVRHNCGERETSSLNVTQGPVWSRRHSSMALRSFGQSCRDPSSDSKFWKWKHIVLLARLA